jgi:hypothetical protein
MKRLFAAILLWGSSVILLSFFSTASFAQFRSDLAQPDPPLNTASAMQGGNFFSQLFDPSHFNMHQSFSSTFISGGGASMGISMFTNTFAFRPMDDLYVSADVSAVYSPYNSLGSAFANSMNGLYLTNAQIDWKLSDNAFLKVQYLGGPAAGMYGAFNSFYNPFYNNPASPTSGFAAGAAVQVH